MEARVMREAGQLAGRPGGPPGRSPPLPSASVVAASEDQAVAVLQGIGASLREHAPQMR